MVGNRVTMRAADIAPCSEIPIRRSQKGVPGRGPHLLCFVRAPGRQRTAIEYIPCVFMYWKVYE